MVTRLEQFDPNVYQPVPRLPVAELVSMTRALIDAIPEPAPAYVELAATAMKQGLTELEAAIDQRRRTDSEPTVALESELDSYVDGLWISLRSRLESWSPYQRPAPARIVEREPNKTKLAGYLVRATRAERLLARLFGPAERSLTQRSYPEQAAIMASILRIIDDDQLGPDIDAIVGPDLLDSIRDGQLRYEAMVNARAIRDARPTVNLRALGQELRQRVGLYTIKVLSLVDPAAPSSIARVEASLQPLLSFRPRISPPSNGREREEVTIPDSIEDRLVSASDIPSED